MKVNIISFSFVRGGAAIAARKFAEILERHGFDVQRVSQDNAGASHFILRLISYFIVLLQKTKNPVKHSINLFSYRKVLDTFKAEDSLTHIHWVNNDTLGVFSLDKIPRNSIVTLHDEWLFCGTEHYCDFFQHQQSLCKSQDNALMPFEYGYAKGLFEGYGLNLGRWVWSVKQKMLSARQDIIFTVPSTWMFKRAKSSLILKNADVRILPNPIATDVFDIPLDRISIRHLYGFLDSDIILTFGAIDGNKNPVKGASLLLEALLFLPKFLPIALSSNIKLVMFGGRKNKDDFKLPFPYLDIGHIKDQNKLAQIYAMSDCVIVPSYVESFGQVAAEAQACGVPVVAFNTSGLSDVVLDGQTGFLAEAFSPLSLAEKISFLLKMSPCERQELGSNARKHIVGSFSYEVISRQYLSIIHEVIARVV